MKMNKWVAVLAAGSILALAACNAPNNAETKVDVKDAAPAVASVPVQTNVSPAPPTPTPPPSKLTLLGEWASVGEKCAVEFMDGNGDGVPDDASNLTIASDGMSGYEWGCKIRPRIQSGTTYEGKSICFDRDEGMDMPATSLTLKLQDNGNLVMVDDDGRSEWKRCK
jgi:hypothetical protein